MAGSDQTAQRAAVQNPVKSVHNDYTEVSGPQRVRDFLPERAEELVNQPLCHDQRMAAYCWARSCKRPLP